MDLSENRGCDETGIDSSSSSSSPTSSSSSPPPPPLPTLAALSYRLCPGSALTGDVSGEEPRYPPPPPPPPPPPWGLHSFTLSST